MKENILKLFIEKGFLLDKEMLDFLNELRNNSFFGIFRVLEFDSSKHFLKIENIFDNKVYEFHNKSLPIFEE